MDQQDAVVSRLNCIDHRITGIGGATLGLLALGLLAAMAFQDPETISVRDVVADQDGEVVTAYQSDGTKAWQGRFVDAKREGPWIVWSSRWTLLGQFENDKKVGTWRKFANNDGQLIEEGVYDDGLRKGLWQTWHNLRRFDRWRGPEEPLPLESSDTYVKGKRHGKWTFLYWDGQKRAEG